jgi:hypothetical protein
MLLSSFKTGNAPSSFLEMEVLNNSIHCRPFVLHDTVSPPSSSYKRRWELHNRVLATTTPHVAPLPRATTACCLQVATVWASIRLQRLRVRESQRVLHAYSVAISSPLPSCCPYLAVRSHWFQIATVWPPNHSQRRRVCPPLTCPAYILHYTRRVLHALRALFSSHA